MADRRRKNATQRCALTGAIAASLLFAGCANNEQGGGTAIGAIAGGLIGNQFRKGSGKVATTLAGAVVAALSATISAVRSMHAIASSRAEPNTKPGRAARLASLCAGAILSRYGEIIVEDYYYRSFAMS